MFGALAEGPFRGAVRMQTSKTKRVSARPTPKPTVRRPPLSGVRVSTHEVSLHPLHGTPGKGGCPGGEKWRIDYAGMRAGEVFINLIDERPLGQHASIQIFLNLKSQGRGIGRIGYFKACQASSHAVIYAHMRKSNFASCKAAEAAGFIDVTPPGVTQLIMVWIRKS